MITSFAPAENTINEGGDVTVTGTFTDVDVLDTHTAVINWGDGTQSAAVVDDSKGSFTATHQYLNNLTYVNKAPPPYTITATVTNSDKFSTSAAAQATVDNVLPMVDGLAATPSSPSDRNAFTLTGHVTDPGTLDPETVLINWGDGTTSTVAADQATRLFSAVHTYKGVVPANQPSVTEDVVVTATDDVGPGAATTLPVTVLGNELTMGPLVPAPGPSTRAAARPSPEPSAVKRPDRRTPYWSPAAMARPVPERWTRRKAPIQPRTSSLTSRLA